MPVSTAAGHNTETPNSAARQFLFECFRQRYDRVFGHRIGPGPKVRVDLQAGDRGGVDDVAAFPMAPHARDKCSDTVDDAFDIDVDDPVPVGAWDLLEPHAEHRNAGIVTDNMDGAEFCLDGGARFLQHGRIRNVGDEGLHVGAEVVQAGARFRQRVFPNIDHRDIGAGLRQRRCNSEAYARCGARNVGGLSFEMLQAFTPRPMRHGRICRGPRQACGAPSKPSTILRY